MNEHKRIIEWKGNVVALGTFLFSILFFFYYSYEFYYSFLGALMTAALVWATYLILRIMLLALKN
jgi:signal transduction histidine kinase